jgi:membrane-bound lytic murein transglycosylase D
MDSPNATKTEAIYMADKLRLQLAMMVFLVILGGCKSRTADQQAVQGYEAIEKSGTETIDEAVESTFEEGRLTDVGNEEEEDLNLAKEVGIPHELNERVEKWIEYFTVRDRDRFQRFMERGHKFKPMIFTVLREQGIPTDLYYLAMIESGFSERAVSRASAVGVWQFIKGTGDRYGLRIDGYVDERRDPMRATVAAALYLNDLHNVFNDWYLAMAAYNSGETRVLRSIMKHNSRDFWELAAKRGLPTETMNYIPKFLAASIIGHNPGRYGFGQVQGELHPTLRPVNVPAPVKLTDVAKYSKIPISILKKYNHNIRRNMTPPGVKTYKIWVPESYEAQLKSVHQTLMARRISGLRNYVAGSSSNTIHKVRRGESLSAISRKYRTTVAAIKQLNRLRGNKIYVGQKLKVRGSASASYTYKRHRVRRGESLSSIAQRFGTSISRLKRMNKLSRNRIYAGQLLKVKEQRL